MAPDVCKCPRWDNTFRDGREAGGRPLFLKPNGDPQQTGWTGYDCSVPICVQVCRCGDTTLSILDLNALGLARRCFVCRTSVGAGSTRTAMRSMQSVSTSSARGENDETPPSIRNTRLREQDESPVKCCVRLNRLGALQESACLQVYFHPPPKPDRKNVSIFLYDFPSSRCLLV